MKRVFGFTGFRKACALVFSCCLLGFAGQVTPSRKPILYDSLPDDEVFEEAVTLGAMPVLVVYQSIDEESMRTGEINVATVLSGISRLSNGRPPAWGLLDFEEPFFKWLGMPPESSEFKRASKTLTALIVAVRAAYPETKWSFYGIPQLPYWDRGHSWDVMDESCKRRLLEHSIVASKDIVSASDWVCPSVYLFYDPELFDSHDREGVRLAGRIWRAATTRVSKLLSGTRPVIPVTSPLWTEIGRARAGAVVPRDQFRTDGLEPIASAGVDGIMIWTALGWKIDRSLAPDCPVQERQSIFQGLLPADKATSSGEFPSKSALKKAAGRVVIESIRDAREAMSSKETVAP